MIPHDDRSHRREVLQVEVGDHLVPLLFACARIETNQIIVRGFHVEQVVPHAQATVPDVRTAFRFPKVMPDLVTIARIYRPCIIGHGEVEYAIDFEH